MKNKTTKLRWIGWLASVWFAGVTQAQLPTANTLVAVMVLNPKGEPVENAPVSVYSPQGRRFGYTGEAGATTQMLDRIVGLPVFVGVSDSDFAITPPGGYQLARDRFVALRDQYAVPHPKPLLIEGDQFGPIETTIQLLSARPVRGVLHDAAGNPPAEGHVVVWGYYADDATDPETGAFEISTAPSGQDLILLVSTDRSTISMHEFSLTDINDDVIVAPIVHDVPGQDDAEFRMNAEGLSVLYSQQGSPLALGITLVHVSGRYTRGYQYLPQNESIIDEMNPVNGNPLRPHGPAGKYLVVPGSILHDLPIAVLRGIRAGRLEALKAAGVPSITLQPGLNDQFTFNAKDAHDAAMEVIGDLLPALPGN